MGAVPSVDCVTVAHYAIECYCHPLLRSIDQPAKRPRVCKAGGTNQRSAARDGPVWIAVLTAPSSPLL